MCEQHAGPASPQEVAVSFDKQFRWGTFDNPDFDGFDPLAPATAEEIAAGAGLLALAAGD